MMYAHRIRGEKKDEILLNARGVGASFCHTFCRVDPACRERHQCQNRLASLVRYVLRRRDIMANRKGPYFTTDYLSGKNLQKLIWLRSFQGATYSCQSDVD